MAKLSEKTCTACRPDAPQASNVEIQAMMSELPGWEIVEIDAERRLKKVYKFKNFADALAFTDKVGELAESENHHPLLQTEWGKVTVMWWTHKIKGLHSNDFIMASKTDVLMDMS